MDWLNAFSELTPKALEALSQLPRFNKTSLEFASPVFFVEKIIIIHPNPQFIQVKLKQDIFEMDVNLHDLMLNQLPEHPDLQNKINQTEQFALRMVWLELGMKGYWEEGKEKVASEFANTFSATLNRTKWLLEQVYGPVEAPGRPN
ncbi:MAG: hypothetical protein HKM04_06630 [Legionellales bacterium]|nr:hypothetical protein [Legionellales bacterium]